MRWEYVPPADRHTRQVHPAVGAAKFGHLEKDLLGLLELALLAPLGGSLEQQADAVVIPPLPRFLDWRGLVADGRSSRDGVAVHRCCVFPTMGVA